METINKLFETIVSIPHVDTDVKVRAGYLRTQICKRGQGYNLFRVFGW